MRRALVPTLVAMLALAACGDGAPPAPAPPAPARPVFELRAVVKPALAEALARAPIAAVPAAPAEPEAVESVLGALSSPDARLRGLALEDAKALGDGGVAALSAAIADASAEPARRNACAQALGAIATASAVDALLVRLETDGEPWLRAQCAWQIRTAGRDEAVPRLLLRLKYEKDGATVVWIADALASLGNLSGLDGLRVLRDTSRDAAVRADAVERLAAIAAEHGAADGDALYAAWWRGDPYGGPPPREPSDALRREAWDRIQRLSEWDLRRVDDARFILVRLDAWVVPMLAAALHDADVYTRVHAAQCLERRGPRARAAVPALLSALEEPRLAPGAADALGAIGDASAAPTLEETLRSSSDLELRIGAARALGRIGEASSREPLLAVWRAPNTIDLRQAAAGALVLLGNGDLVAPFLLECLTSDGADAGAAEHDLGAWVALMGSNRTHQELAQRWNTLEPASGSVPDAAEVARRREKRASIARALVRRLEEDASRSDEEK